LRASEDIASDARCSIESVVLVTKENVDGAVFQRNSVLDSLLLLKLIDAVILRLGSSSARRIYQLWHLLFTDVLIISIEVDAGGALRVAVLVEDECLLVQLGVGDQRRCSLRCAILFQSALASTLIVLIIAEIPKVFRIGLLGRHLSLLASAIDQARRNEVSRCTDQS
jgi:hypothetical protein